MPRRRIIIEESSVTGTVLLVYMQAHVLMPGIAPEPWHDWVTVPRSTKLCANKDAVREMEVPDE